MAKIDVAQFNRRSTSQRVKAREDQVQNNAGGFVFEVTPWTQMRRFLVLGTEGGTYYVKEPELLKQNYQNTLKCIKEDGHKAVDLIVEVSDKALAPRNDPAIFALALAASHGTAESKEYALASLSKVCRIGTHLFHFGEYVNALRGWGRGLRRAVGGWYVSKEASKLAYQAVKYQARDGWSNSDLLRLSHPTARDEVQDAVLRWMVGGMAALGEREVKGKQGDVKVRKYASLVEKLPRIITAFEEAKKADTKTLVKLIVEHDLPREALPTEKLNEVAVWEALLQKMPMTAMIRNLGKMTSIGLVKPLSDASRKIIAQLKDKEALTKARVHPMALLMAVKVYEQGHGDKGSLQWSPVPAVVSALENAFYAAYSNVKPVGGPLLLGLDVSGSMCSPIMNSCLTCAEGVTALSLIHLNVEADGDAHVMGFDTGIRDLGVRKNMSLADALKKASNINGGGTDCSLPAMWAKENKVKLNGIFILTDSETWAGRVQPFQALTDYRNTMGVPVRQVVVGMTSTGFTIADPRDPLSMDVVGFDASAPAVMADFAGGRLV